ncbi:ubiquitin carboxyl-terminal hydrolase 47 isoform X1 [Drosophila nasuta]|uniref:ubiquitin carboxyl-terminal hydrolase 47 isoform X1 n=1 Tax=Drosophila nasuta TaxID=42062 RepID=UPI00295E907F|nr:ubiquitin carboxyl-terminal hydrolase 47 isoform X1 [Drosophila nasuta]XP_060658376.1 ubiquitin carboxyl-terminal hydrolase 47 isoform X1 [Drosophila nasuta]
MAEQAKKDSEETTQCVVFDQTPGSQQKKINIVVRDHFTVQRVITLIGTQFAYDKFELLLQPHGDKDLVYLNALDSQLLYDVTGFERKLKNNLVLLPEGSWDGNVAKRYELIVKKTVTVKKKDLDSAESTTTTAKSGDKEKKKKSTTTSTTITASGELKKKKSPSKTKTSSSSVSPTTDDTAVASPVKKSTKLKAKPSEISLKPIPNEQPQPQQQQPLELEDLEPQPINCDGMPEIPIDELTKVEITEQLQQLPQNRLLISPVDDVASELFNISPVSDVEPLSDDDLALGASASPTMMGPPFEFGNAGPTESDLLSATQAGADALAAGKSEEEARQDLQFTNFFGRKYGGDDVAAWQRTNSSAADFVANSANTEETESHRNGPGPRNYVGLVNQAMTCYLNSLLQALYMTPEFRNALYRWEFDNDNEAKNIPYQLQKLFLNLQTSSKSSVETTDLTRSFGWDSTEAWQQHDIQELCRVMFDALEHKFKNTKQANLISTLYEGKMNDYVKCLECNTEKTREDTFLDIPLPVRPYGSSSAYGSIEEALRAFVQPETLDGNNQYLCEKCKKKCDAHKGLHFKSFPYILTLHLKRFDFDYQTMHRIKLNDRVTFPQRLNLNSFVNRTPAPCEQYQMNGSSSTTVDDCSTADSGSAMEEDNLSSGVGTTASSSQHENDMNDEDEGIDMSSSTTGKSGHMDQRLKQEPGPYHYELFAIMIHSGSASGGHYYAYIKEFENNDWFSFNDQNVSSITQEDIQRSFGGPNGSYYSSAYTSSTNAYMLMYRQVDAKRNELAAKASEFPEHIKTLLPKLHAEEETRSTRLGRHITVADLAMPAYKPRVYFYNPTLKKMKMTRVYLSVSFDANRVLESAHTMLNVEQFAPLSRCRLVAYNSAMDTIIQSLESFNDPALTELRSWNNYNLDFLLEHRAEDQEFESYASDGTTWYVFIVDLSTMAMDGPFLVSSAARERSDALRHSIAMRLHISEQEFLLATVRGCGSNPKAFVAYDPHPSVEAQEKLQQLASTQFRYITYFYLDVPNTDASTLEMLGVPSSELPAAATEPPLTNGCDVVDAAMMNGIGEHGMSNGNGNNDCDWRRYKRDQPDPLAPLVTPGHESNSEDSSLSDGDRTLVENSMQHRGGGDSQVSSTSHSPQLSSPEDEAASHDAMMRVRAYCNENGGYAGEAGDTLSSHSFTPSTTQHFFHALKISSSSNTTTTTTTTHSSSSSAHQSDEESQLRKPTQSYKLFVGSRMGMGSFKQHIEQLIRVPGDYFRLHEVNGKHDNTISSSQHNSIITFNEGDTLTVELGKTLSPDEYKAKIYYLRLGDLDNETAKLACVCEWVYKSTTTTEQAKQELVAKLHRIDAKYESLTVENCRIWLKGGRSPIKILESDETLYCDMRTTITTEFILQECEAGVVAQPSDDSLTIFVRRWCPQKWEFGKFQEITLEKDSEIKSCLAKICDISIDNLSYVKVNSNFPYTSISAVSVNDTMSWSSDPVSMEMYPLCSTQCGNMYLYKDKSVAVRELSEEERRSLNNKEKARLDRLGCISSTTRYSQRRERALKIYLDSPEKPSNVTASAPIDAHAAN